MIHPVLCIDFGSTFTKVTAIDIKKPEILATAQAFTTVQDDINNGLNIALAAIVRQTNITHWPERYACSSAAGGLKMIAIGLVPQLTAEAAKRAALSAGAKVIKTFSYELNAQEILEIEAIAPDIILFTGGIDGGNTKVVLENTQKLASLKHRCPLIYAGNKVIADQVHQQLNQAHWEVYVVDNVMPTLNQLQIDSAQACIRQVFLKHIIVAKGLSSVQATIDNILMPTPSAVLKAAELLSKGHLDYVGIGELMIIDVGGATTDVHSVAEGTPKQSNVLIKGLSEPYVKRTVEGDLGARYSLQSLVDGVGIDLVASVIKTTSSNIQKMLDDLKSHPEQFDQEPGLLKTLDDVAAEIAVNESVTRHVGFLEVHYTPLGTVYVQTGKDCSYIHHIIGTGGPLIHHSNIHSALKASQYDANKPLCLKPSGSRFYLDHQYILAAMGLLVDRYPDVALKIMKSSILEV